MAISNYDVPLLTADELDDLHYLARAKEKDELDQLVSELAAKYDGSKPFILAAAIDPDSGNTALHFAAANGHTGTACLTPLLSFEWN
jgi:uncharacterized protein